MKDSIGDEARLRHIVDSINEIEKYTSGISFQNFSRNSMMVNAAIRQLEIIGEAANHISIDMRSKYDDIEWDNIIGLRNILIHEYFGVDINIIWDIIKNDIIDLKEKINKILNSM